MKKLSVAVALAITGCATNTGVLPASDDNYTVMRQGTSFLVSTAELKTQATREATDYCDTKKKQVKIIHVKEIPAGAFGRWPEAEILFTCK